MALVAPAGNADGGGARVKGTRFAKGLVVGKFCPLHHGHELVIQRAIAACDEVFVISYSKPEFPLFDRATREGWIRSIFPLVRVLVIDDDTLAQLCAALHLELRQLPANDAPDDVHREFVAWLCISILKTRVDAVFTSESYGDGFAAALSNLFGQPVVHQCVDQERRVLPVSGTAIRERPHAFRRFMSPKVYASFVKRACFIGGESSGKSTIASALAARFGTSWVPEYGRELWDARNGALRFDDMERIAEVQVARENTAAGSANRWLFCDTSPLTTLQYCQAMFGRATHQLQRLSHRHYDAVFLCEPDFAFVQDGTRKDEAFRREQHEWTTNELNRRHVDFVHLNGSVEKRIATVARHLQLFLPDDTFMGLKSGATPKGGA